ncbi:hypothetical protein PQO01_19580 [Lentisphaera marina]|uniref:hypothetical protein n=1 Tax=Lentisphaera marina TaxID=1111041 RepID=UPI002365BC11|nr:hypothetical protein [Lentisphaera marina]MDD7987158.1 hypothetical protein [Lentisphaera marina]
MKNKKVTVATVLTIGLFVLSGYIYFRTDHQLANGKGIAIHSILPLALIGLWYISRGGNLPDWLHKFTEMSPFGGTLNRDDDPRNLPILISLGIPITLLLLVIYAFIKA